MSLKPCSCSTAGSSAPLCHLLSGQCPCRDGFTGRSCDHCAPGYYGYPACSACDCDLAGTNETFCNKSLGVCECGWTGECVCKVRTRTGSRSTDAANQTFTSCLMSVQAGVSGRRCEECVSGWFALSDQNPNGCSDCFCSGLSKDCEELGGLTRVPVSTAPISHQYQINIGSVQHQCYYNNTYYY